MHNRQLRLWRFLRRGCRGRGFVLGCHRGILLFGPHCQHLCARVCGVISGRDGAGIGERHDARPTAAARLAAGLDVAAHLDGHATDDAVVGEGKELVAGRRLGDTERAVSTVVALLDGIRATHRAAGRNDLAVLADAEMDLVLEAHEQDRVGGDAAEGAALDDLGAGDGVDDHVEGRQPDVDLALRHAADLDVRVDGERVQLDNRFVEGLVNAAHAGFFRGRPRLRLGGSPTSSSGVAVGSPDCSPAVALTSSTGLTSMSPTVIGFGLLADGLRGGCGVLDGTQVAHGAERDCGYSSISGHKERTSKTPPRVSKVRYGRWRVLCDGGSRPAALFCCRRSYSTASRSGVRMNNPRRGVWTEPSASVISSS